MWNTHIETRLLCSCFANFVWGGGESVGAKGSKPREVCKWQTEAISELLTFRLELSLGEIENTDKCSITRTNLYPACPSHVRSPSAEREGWGRGTRMGFCSLKLSDSGEYVSGKLYAFRILWKLKTVSDCTAYGEEEVCRRIRSRRRRRAVEELLQIHTILNNQLVLTFPPQRLTIFSSIRGSGFYPTPRTV